MSELDLLKQKKLEELQNAQEEQLQVQQQIQQLESVVKKALTRDALSRYGNLRSAHPEKAIQLLVVLAQFLEQGKLKVVDDLTLKQLLLTLQPAKKEFKITRK